MVEITYKDSDGREQIIRVRPENAKDRRQQILAKGWTVVDIGESYPGEIRDAESLQELRLMLPALRKLVATVTLPMLLIAGVLMLRKLHLVRPDLIPFPVDYPVYA